MSSSQFHAKKEIISFTTKANNNNNNINGMLSPSLKINKDSYFIKKSSSSSSSSPPSSSSSSSSSTSSPMVVSNKPPQQHRHPVIIYTHSPRVIHTHPKDFMALVQKLTGLSHSQEDDRLSNQSSQPMRETQSDRKKVSVIKNEDNDTSFVVTEDNNCSNNVGENRVNSCFIVAEPPPLNPYMTNFSVLAPNSTDFLCSSQPLLNFPDSLFFSHNMRTSIPYSTTLEGMKGFGDY